MTTFGDLCDDNLFELLRQIDYQDVINVCRLNKAFAKLCEREKEEIKQKQLDYLDAIYSPGGEGYFEAQRHFKMLVACQ